MSSTLDILNLRMNHGDYHLAVMTAGLLLRPDRLEDYHADCHVVYCLFFRCAEDFMMIDPGLNDFD